eukprot:jgi/Undpi1/12028/HiC_scaffold_4.g01727.m1
MCHRPNSSEIRISIFIIVIVVLGDKSLHFFITFNAPPPSICGRFSSATASILLHRLQCATALTVQRFVLASSSSSSLSLATNRSSRVSDGREPLAPGDGLITVAQIQAQILSTLLWNGLGLTALYVIVCGAWFMFSNEWTFTNTVYFVTMSSLTVGYGDLVVRDAEIDRLVDSVVILWGLGTLCIWAAYAGRAMDSIRAQHRRGQGSVAVFMLGEDEGLFTSLYWVIVTSSTIGYGDVVPTTGRMKWFTVFYSIVATGCMLETLRFGAAYPFYLWALRAQAKVSQQFATPQTLEDRAQVALLAESAVADQLGTPPEGRPGGINRSDFALTMLLMLNRISYEDYERAARMFELFPGEIAPRRLAQPTSAGDCRAISAEAYEASIFVLWNSSTGESGGGAGGVTKTINARGDDVWSSMAWSEWGTMTKAWI